MEQNKTGKYLKYAIGEIVLVFDVSKKWTFQVNNLNEASKLKTKEQKVLKELKGNIEENIRNKIKRR